MADSAAMLADEALPHQPMRQGLVERNTGNGMAFFAQSLELA